jgi:hypothetical protein
MRSKADGVVVIIDVSVSKREALEAIDDAIIKIIGKVERSFY